MDSRQLHHAASHISQIVTWDKEWLHFGTGSDIKLSLVQELIDEFLKDDTLQLVHDRINSKTIKRTEIVKAIHDLLGQQSFQVWNSTMDKVIKFDRIGVLLTGRRHI
ncbi:hypothetical protein KK083_04050 [Fulvivirgaceae bacterium PWU4]|uniref:Uncharacterized protein n=1 Tax=Chryseosolibacter histidini TaxID=2782349 RepID=A0AAP2GHH6_9BACT|nr:hypothetical protein [Chryseosolibacter histidini]MBT1696036.1 hypothetical protein [Chryseosolibacter histidini]